MNEPFVAILMGSDGDLPQLKGACEVLKDLGVRYEVRVTSAHRTPDATRDYVKDAQARGCQVFIAAAGMAAHLAGAVAAQTTRPVIGVPVEGGPLKGQDALLSTVMMPAGVPVACVAIGSQGARNAGFLAAQILALADPALDARVQARRAQDAEGLAARDARAQEALRAEGL